MEEKIIIGHLICSGKKVGGFYKEPFVRIKADSEVIFRAEEIFSKVVLVAPVLYREATTELDNPSFIMAVYDEKGKLLDTIEENHEDEVSRFDSLDSELRYEISPQKINEYYDNEKSKEKYPIEVTYKVNLKTKLEISRWNKKANKKTPIKVLHVEKDVFIHIKAEKICNVMVSLDCGNSAVWKRPYHIYGHVRNTGPKKVGNISIDIWEEKSPGSRKKIQMLNSIDELKSGEAKRFSTAAITKDWPWWKSDKYSFTIMGPYKKKCDYKVAVSVKTENTKVKDPFWSLFVSTLTRKYSAAEYAKLMAHYIRVRLGWIANLRWMISIFGDIFGFRNWLIGEHQRMIRHYTRLKEEAEAEARDPIEYDRHFDRKYDYKKIMKKSTEANLTEKPHKKFLDMFNEIISLNKSVGISYNRFMSAIKMGERRSTKLQKDNIENMITLMEDDLINLKQLYEEIKALEVGSKVDYDEKTMKNHLEETKGKGLPDNMKKELQKEGITNATLVEIEKSSRETKVSDLIPDTSDFDSLYKFTLNSNVESMYKVKEIKRIYRLKGNNLQRELFNVGLLTPLEFYDKMDNLNKEKSYPIVEVEGISGYYKEKLFSVNIKTTKDLLDKCKRPNDRKKLAKITGLSKKLILEWANLADLMRIQGVGEEYADMLEEVGVDTVAELARRKSNIFYKVAKDYVKTTRLVRRVPSKTQIESWIKQAKKLGRILEY